MLRTVKIIFIIIAIISFSYIVIYFYDMHNAKNQSLLLNEISLSDFNSTDNTENNISVETLKDSPKVIEKNERMLKVEELQKQNPDIIGWIEILGTLINYPVLQCSDNDFYVDHNYKKQVTQSGSIFLDANYSWNPESTNLLIYGHNMKNGTMFTSLLNYKSKSYYNAHPLIRFTTSDNDVTYEIIAVFESKVYSVSDAASFKYYNFINSSNKEDFDNYIYNIKKISLYDTGKTAEYGDSLMTLSTCAYHTKNGRFAVVAKKVPN